MKQVRIVGCIISILFIVSGCNQKKESITTESGITYSYVKHGDGEEVETNEFLVMNLEYRDQNDSIWMSTSNIGTPVLFQKKDSVVSNNDAGIYEIFHNLVLGDSITFQMNAAEFFLKTYRMPLPQNMPNTTLLTFRVGVQDVYNKEEFELYQKIERLKFENKMELERLKQDSIDMVLIHEYIKENNLQTIETESGLNYFITKKGNGRKPESADRVRVNYTGHVLGGDFFDSSIKSIAQENGLYNPQREPYEPFEFTVGSGGVIKGWDEALRLLDEGDQATIILPSKLGYGPRSMGNKIRPFSILVFDIEFLEIKNESK